MRSDSLVGAYAVIFISNRTEVDAGYDLAAERMLALAATQRGFLGVRSVRDATGLGITVSYWQTQADIQAWKMQSEHAAVREQGRKNWYQDFELQVCKIERAYQFEQN